jgi:2-amino-4-hydroxy-6-hydroxymethyldihydropteridine diphosphokinase
MNKAYLMTGGNIGDRAAWLAKARAKIGESCGEIVSASGLYETAAWGNPNQAAFLNQALELKTPMAGKRLLETILSIEQKMGRIRDERFGPRIIDIDILLYNNEIIGDRSLQVPHPRMHLRRFVLTPLAEIAGSVIHPVLGKSIDELLMECPDDLPVRKLI